MNIITIKNVNGYVENNIAYLKLEDVSRGLGFEKTEIKNGKEYKSIRWERIFSYLEEFSLDHKWAKESYIPENIFYKLCMKANNEVARKFQDLVCDEILPSIRKHGAYMTKETLNKAITSPDFLIELATNLKAEQEKNNKLVTKIEEDKPKVVFAEALLISDKSILINELAKILAQNGIDIGGRRLFEWLRNNGYLCSRGEEYNLPTQYSMNLGLMEVKRSVHNNPDGSSKVNRTPKITAKGQQYFINKFKKMKALEEQFVRY